MTPRNNKLDSILAQIAALSLADKSATAKRVTPKRARVVREPAVAPYVAKAPSLQLASAYVAGAPCPFCKKRNHISAAGRAEPHPNREKVVRQRFVGCKHTINIR
jgi:hypothetical protein